jgi:hypothetical protein
VARENRIERERRVRAVGRHARKRSVGPTEQYSATKNNNTKGIQRERGWRANIKAVSNSLDRSGWERAFCSVISRWPAGDGRIAPCVLDCATGGLRLEEGATHTLLLWHSSQCTAAVVPLVSCHINVPILWSEGT